MSGQQTDRVVFILRKETQCSRCERELEQSEFICLAGREALCLECAGLAHLEYLPAGDAAVTRRAAKYSGVHVVVMKKSVARKRSERQGILAEPEAIRRAEAESAADAQKRSERQAKAAERRAEEDRAYVSAFAEAILRHFPGCPPEDARQIAAHACLKYSGRVGRSAAAKSFDADAVRLAVVARIRHSHTDYDRLLDRYEDRGIARDEVQEEIEEVLRQWEGGQLP